MKRRLFLTWSAPVLTTLALPAHAQTSMPRIVQSIFVFCPTATNPNFEIIPELIISPQIAGAEVKFNYTIEDNTGAVLFSNDLVGETNSNGVARFMSHMVPAESAGDFVFTNTVTTPDGTVLTRADRFPAPYVDSCA